MLLRALRQLLRRQGRGLRLAADPLHGSLLRAAGEGVERWLSFRPTAVWGELVAGGVVDAAVVSVAGVAANTAGWRPPLQRPGLAVVPLGQRPLRLLLHRCHRRRLLLQRSGPTGWLLPPVALQPLLHQQLQAAGPWRRWSCRSVTARGWLERLRSEPLVLPADGTLLQQPGWCGAPLCWLEPPLALQERLWVVLREEELRRRELRQLLKWWGGLRLVLP